MKDNKEKIRDIVKETIEWAMECNYKVTKENGLPIIFIDASPHCNHVTFRPCVSSKQFTKSLDEDMYSVQIQYDKDNDSYVNRIEKSIRGMKELYKYACSSSVQYFKIRNMCVNLIGEVVFLNKTDEIIVSQILSKEKILDTQGIEYEIDKLYTRVVK